MLREEEKENDWWGSQVNKQFVRNDQDIYVPKLYYCMIEIEIEIKEPSGSGSGSGSSSPLSDSQLPIWLQKASNTGCHLQPAVFLSLHKQPPNRRVAGISSWRRRAPSWERRFPAWGACSRRPGSWIPTTTMSTATVALRCRSDHSPPLLALVH